MGNIKTSNQVDILSNIQSIISIIKLNMDVNLLNDQKMKTDFFTELMAC